MKKLLALALALSLMLSAFTVFVTADDEVAEPSAYLVLMNEEIGNTPYVMYTVPGEKLTGPVDIEALVYFGEDCEGTVYLNIYPYDEGGSLLHWTDYAKNSTVELGKWTLVKLENWDLTKDGKAVSYATLTQGFYQAKGTLKIAYVKMSVGGEEVFCADYSEGFDISEATVSDDVTEETKGTKWDYVEAHEGEYTNLAATKSYTVTGIKLRGDAWDDSKAGKLTDRVKGSGEPASDVYFGFKCLNPEEEVDELNVDVVIDLGEVKDFDKVTADVIFGKWGIDAPVGVKVSASVDGETYSTPVDAAAEDLEGFVNDWQGRLFTASGKFNGRYVKVSYIRTYNVGKDNHIWTSEIEVFGYGIPAEEVPEEPEEEIPEPESYITLVCENSNSAPGLTFSVPAELAGGKNISIEALVYFGEDCGGNVYLNLYPYDAENNLLRWTDYAKATVTGMGAWKKAVVEDWDPTKDGKEPAVFKLGAGFYLSTGTLSFSYIKVFADGEEIWSVDFANGIDLTDETLYHPNVTAETEGTAWYLTGANTSEEPSEPEQGDESEDVSEPEQTSEPEQGDESEPEGTEAVTENIKDLGEAKVISSVTFTAANPEGLESVKVLGSVDGEAYYDINAGAAVTVTDGVATCTLEMANDKNRGFVKARYIKVVGEPDVSGTIEVVENEVDDAAVPSDPAGPYPFEGLNENGYGVAIFTAEDAPEGFGLNDQDVFTSNGRAVKLNSAIITIAERQEDGTYKILWNDCNGWTAETGAAHLNTPEGVEGVTYENDKVILGEDQILLVILSSGAYETAGDGVYATAKWMLRGLTAGDVIEISGPYADDHGNAYLDSITFLPAPEEAEPEPANPDESEQEPEESEPAQGEESENEGNGEQGGDNAPDNGDAGVIVLAVVSVIALGAAVVIKKRK